MDIRNVKTFVRVAELKSFTKAAEKLNYVQSTVTAQIKQLEKENALALSKQLNGKEITITATKGANGKMFGSITSKEISEALTKLGFTIDKKQIVLKDPIKMTGKYTVTVKVYAEISSTISVVVC